MDKKYFQSLLKVLLYIGICIGIIFIGLKSISLFWPFIVAYILALAVSPVIDAFDTKFKIKPKYASFFLTGLILGLIVLFFIYIGLLIYHNIPTALNYSLEFFEDLKQLQLPFGLNFESIVDKVINNMSSIIEYIVTKISQETTLIISAIPDIFFKLVVTILASYFLIADRKKLSRFLLNNSSEEIREKGSIILQESKELVNAYIISQFKLMFIVGIVLGIGFFIIGINPAIIIPLTIFISFVDFLPIFGSGTILIPWILYNLVQQNFKMAISLLLLYLAVTFIRQALSPKIVGTQIGIGAFPSLVIMYFGYLFGGWIGLIISVPVGVLLLNLYKEGFFDDFINEVKYIVNETKNIFIKKGGN